MSHLKKLFKQHRGLISINWIWQIFHTPGQVDILLDADVAPAILTGDRIAGPRHHPTAFGTVFGWVLIGPDAAMTSKSVTSVLVTSESTLEKSLSKF